jgi:hypothetical protein
MLPMVRKAAECIVLTLPWKTYVPTSLARRRSKYSTTGNPMGRMDSPSLLSSNRTQLALLSETRVFSGHDVFEDLVDVSLRQILDPPGPYEGNDMMLDTAGLGDDR